MTPDALSVREAADRYMVSRATLAHDLRCGVLDGWKIQGHHGLEWRVSPGTLTAAGYQLRAEAGASNRTSAAVDELDRCRNALAAERRRADQLAQRLQESLAELEIARKRAEALASAPRQDHHLSFAERGLLATGRTLDLTKDLPSQL